MDGTIEYPLINPDEMAAEAWAAMARQDADEALRLWTLLRQQFPERAEAYVWPIQVLWQTGRVDEAEVMAATAFARFPENLDLLGQYAWIAMTRQRWDEALRWWEAVRSRAPDRPDGYIWAARALWLSDHLDEADAMAAQAIKRFSGDVAALSEHAWVAVARRDWQQAQRRWLEALRVDPDRLEAIVGAIRAMRALGNIDDAEAMAREALPRFSDSADLLIEHVWTAAARDDWDAADARMKAARGKLQDPARFEESLAWVAEQLRLRAGSTAVTGAAPARPAAPPLGVTVAPDPAVMSSSELMLSFESLGERCDFGAVQRHYGVEPLGLLRFAFSPFDSLIAALDDRFEAVGTVEDTAFELYKDENILHMKKYGLLFHTFVSQQELNTEKKHETFRNQQRRRLLFLKEKLISDLQDPQKIYIYATNERTSDADAKRLFQALRAYGPNSLLYVRPARRGRPEGTVEVLDNGLFAGHFTRLIDFLIGEQPPFELWRGMCERTYQLAHGGG